MAKYYGQIGFVATSETTPGIWTETVTERNYYGDILKSNRKIQVSDKINSDISISNRISVVMDSFAEDNIFSIKYITYRGAKWIVSDVEVLYPRLIFTLGGLYNG